MIDMKASDWGMASIRLGGNTIYDSDNKPGMTRSMILMEAGSTRSGVSVLGMDYNGGVKLSSDRISVTVCGDNEKPRVTMQNSEHGGRLDVYGKTDDVTRVSLGINEYGNGAVSTWDKNGYWLGTLK